ncbi:MAG: ATP-binding cassette domain-containing protein [Planctomycetota bacterium]
MLTASGLSKSFGGKLVFQDVSLKLEAGTITTLLGPSGSGKTTLLNVLAMTDVASSGEIDIDGRLFAVANDGWSAKAPRPELTKVDQRLGLWPNMSLRQNIVMPLQARGIKDLSLVEELVAELKMSTFVDRYPNQVSVGQQQICAFVRHVVLKPKYLLLDEITSALDVEYVSRILGRLKVLSGTGVAILLTTHLIGFARQSADRVLFLDGGRIVEEGPSEVIDAPKSRRFGSFLSMVMEAR